MDSILPKVEQKVAVVSLNELKINELIKLESEQGYFLVQIVSAARGQVIVLFQKLTINSSADI